MFKKNRLIPLIAIASGGVASLATSFTFVSCANSAELTKIDVTTLPNQTEYKVGDRLDLTGMEVTAYFSDGSSRDVTDYTTNPISGQLLDDVGEQTVDVHYTVGNITKDSSFTIFVTDSVLTDLKVTTLPKIEYKLGDTLDLTGMEVTAYFSDKSSRKVTNYKTDPVDGSIITADTSKVTISYTFNGVEKQTAFNLIIETAQLSAIRIAKTPDKTTYFAGEKLKLEGLEVWADYTDHSTKQVFNYTTNPSIDTPLTTQMRDVKVSFTESSITKTATFDITVKEASLSYIDITRNPYKTEYWAGETLDLEGLEVTAYFSDGSHRLVTGYTTNPSIDTPLTASMKEVEVVYEYGGLRRTDKFSIDVKDNQLTSLRIDELPQVTYWAGETLKLDGLKVSAVYASGLTRQLDKKEYSTTPQEGTILKEDTTVYVLYEERGIKKDAAFQVYVSQPWAVGLEVTKLPTKTKYIVGETLNLEGLEVTAYFGDESHHLVEDYTTDPVEGTTLSIVGEQTITVSYTDYYGIELSDKFTINVSPQPIPTPTLDRIEITKNPDKMTYELTETLKLEGLEVTAYFSDGSYHLVDGYTTDPVEGTTLSVEGKQLITVSYAENEIVKTAEFYVNVKRSYSFVDDLSSNTSTLTKYLGDGGIVITPDHSYNGLPVTKIGNRAFDSTAITSLTIAETVESIGEYAFSSCISLTSVTIPNSVASIDAGAFAFSFKLSEINVANCDFDIIPDGWKKTSIFRGLENNTGVIYCKESSVEMWNDYFYKTCGFATSWVIKTL